MTIITKNERKATGAAFADVLRTRGLRLTGPRRVVLEMVRGTDSHPTAEGVHQMVRRRLPRVSLGTVYRNLRLLVAQGLVKQLPGPHARFDGNVSDHHHFTCLGCGRIVDIAGPLTEPHSRALCGRVAAEVGASVSHHRIEFYGRCLDCRMPGGRRKPRGGRTGARRPGRAMSAARREDTPAPAGITHTQPRAKEELSWQGRASRAPRVTRT